MIDPEPIKFHLDGGYSPRNPFIYPNKNLILVVNGIVKIDKIQNDKLNDCIGASIVCNSLSIVLKKSSKLILSGKIKVDQGIIIKKPFLGKIKEYNNGKELFPLGGDIHRTVKRSSVLAVQIERDFSNYSTSKLKTSIEAVNFETLNRREQEKIELGKCNICLAINTLCMTVLGAFIIDSLIKNHVSNEILLYFTTILAITALLLSHIILLIIIHLSNARRYLDSDSFSPGQDYQESRNNKELCTYILKDKLDIYENINIRLRNIQERVLMAMIVSLFGMCFVAISIINCIIG